MRLRMKDGKQVKVAATSLSDNQELFSLWCQHAKVPHATCRSKEEAHQALALHGAFNGVANSL